MSIADVPEATISVTIGAAWDLTKASDYLEDQADDQDVHDVAIDPEMDRRISVYS